MLAQLNDVRYSAAVDSAVQIENMSSARQKFFDLNRTCLSNYKFIIRIKNNHTNGNTSYLVSLTV